MYTTRLCTDTSRGWRPSWIARDKIDFQRCKRGGEKRKSQSDRKREIYTVSQNRAIRGETNENTTIGVVSAWTELNFDNCLSFYIIFVFFFLFFFRFLLSAFSFSLFLYESFFHYYYFSTMDYKLLSFPFDRVEPRFNLEGRGIYLPRTKKYHVQPL